MDREEIFALIQQNSWPQIIELFKINQIYNEIQSDGITKKIIQENFVNELIEGNSFSRDSAYKYYLEQFYLLHKAKQYDFKLNKSEFQKVVVKIVSEYKELDDLNNAYKYAQEMPDLDICKKIIEQYVQNFEDEVNHSQIDDIQIKLNHNIQDVDCTQSLFQSKQEYNFYKAVREVFQSYMVFPNVALNAIINFKLIKHDLNKDEKDFFFKGLIDCVVIDQENNYKPSKFIELDSIHHDTEDQKYRDKLKDSILSKAGHKLFRIRTREKEIEEEQFKKLINEIIR